MDNERLPNPRELGRYMVIAQVGLEMAAAVAIGWLMDYWFDWQPWGIIAGAVLGLVLGVTHLAMLLDRPKK